MSQGFDPYFKWLGIPPEDQPPSHYRLLGVPELVDDADVIEAAADRQMTHLRTYQVGKNSKLSQKLLNEVSQARVCLLNPDQKQAYDNQLRASTAADSLSQQAVTPAPLNLPTMPTRPLPMSPPQPAPQMAPAPVQINSQAGSRRKALWKNPAVIGLAITGVLGLALVLVIRSAITGGKPETSITQQTTDTTPTPPVEKDPTKTDDPPEKDPPKDQNPTANVNSPQGLVPLNFARDSSNIDLVKIGESRSFLGHTDAITAASFSSNGRYVVSASEDKTIKIWEARSGREVRSLTGHSLGVTEAIFTPDDRRLVSVSSDGTLRVWDVQSGKQQQKIDIGGVIYCLAISPDGKKCATGGRDHLVRLWDIEKGTEITTITGHKSWVMSVAFSPDGKYLATATQGKEQMVRLLDLDTSEVHKIYNAKAGFGYQKVAFSPNGKYLVAGGFNGTNVWNRETTQEIYHLTAVDTSASKIEHTIFDVAISPDNQYVMTAGMDHTARVWNLADGKLASTFRGHGNIVRAVGFSPNGRYVLSGSGQKYTGSGYVKGDDNSVRLWAYRETTTGSSLSNPVVPPRVVDAPPAKNKHPLPSDTQQQIILTQIEEVYEISAAKTPEQKLKLAGELLALGKKAENDPNEKFVLLRNAMELAQAGGDAALMLAAIDEIGNDFEIEVSDVQQTMLIGFARDAKQESSIGSLARVYDDYVATAIAQQRYEDALKVATAVNAAAQRRAGSKFRKAIYDRRKEVAKLHDDWKTIQDARAALKADPDDAEANLTLGSWYCFEKRLWQQGFSHLAKASDTKLQTLAQRELDSPPADANAQVALADAWYEAANGADDEIKNGLLARAGHWYLQAQKDVTSAVLKSKIEKQLEEIDKIVSLGIPIIKGPIAVSLKLRATLRGYSDHVRSVDFSPDGKTLVTASFDSSVRLWDVATAKFKQKLLGCAKGCNCARFSPDGKSIAVGDYDNKVLVWRAKSPSPLVLKGHTGPVQFVDFSPDGKTLASAGNNGMVILWDLKTGKKLKSFSDASGMMLCVSFSADGKTLLTANNEDTENVKHWDVASGKVLLSFATGDKNRIAVFDPEQQQIITGGSEQTIRFWDAKQGQPRRSLSGHRDRIFSVRFSHDGRLMVSTGGKDKTFRIWDMTTYEELASVVAHDSFVLDAAFSPNGKTLATASADKTVKLWDVEVKSLQRAGGSTLQANDMNSIREFAGVWKVRYTNKHIRVYMIAENGSVQAQNVPNKILYPGKLTRTAKGILLDFNDGKLERLTIKNGKLHIEHFNPKSNYPSATSTTGVGVRKG